MHLKSILREMSIGSEQGEELLLKIESTYMLVKDKVITKAGAIQHFKQWVTDRNRHHTMLKELPTVSKDGKGLSFRKKQNHISHQKTDGDGRASNLFQPEEVYGVVNDGWRNS